MSSPQNADPELESLLTSVEELPGVQRRAVSAILGAAVADAASRPLHWVYKAEDMDRILAASPHLEDGEEGAEKPEFWPENKSPFYSLPTGARSCYSHVMEAGLAVLVGEVGGVEEVKGELERRFGQGTKWQSALAARKEAYSPEKRRIWRNPPILGPWLHGAVIYYLDQGKPNPDNSEMDPFLLSLPYIAIHATEDNVLEEAVKIWRILSISRRTGEWNRAMGELLKKVILGEGLEVEWLTGSYLGPGGECLEDLEDIMGEKHRTVAQRVGNNCHLPGSFQGAVHAALTLPSYQMAVRATIVAGGCNCSRANYIGALLGARDGMKAIPEEWRQKTTDFKMLLKMSIAALK